LFSRFERRICALYTRHDTQKLKAEIAGCGYEKAGEQSNGSFWGLTVREKKREKNRHDTDLKFLENVKFPRKLP
jgi:hypothetical protein